MSPTTIVSSANLMNLLNLTYLAYRHESEITLSPGASESKVSSYSFRVFNWRLHRWNISILMFVAVIWILYLNRPNWWKHIIFFKCLTRVIMTKVSPTYKTSAHLSLGFEYLFYFIFTVSQFQLNTDAGKLRPTHSSAGEKPSIQQALKEQISSI